MQIYLAQIRETLSSELLFLNTFVVSNIFQFELIWTLVNFIALSKYVSLNIEKETINNLKNANLWLGR